MSSFKVVNKSFSFTTKGEIDFVDLSTKSKKRLTFSGIKNGLAHVFAPHATGILILTENDDALLEDIKVLLEELAPKKKGTSTHLTPIRTCGLCFFRQTKLCP